MNVKIPNSHKELLTEPVHAVLTTMMPDGQPQSTLVWCDYDGEHVLVNTTRQRQKGKNMQANPRVSLLVIDESSADHWIEIRGVAEITEHGATEHVDEITRRYTDHPQYYGYVRPKDNALHETRIICKIKPTKINIEVIHS